MHAPVLLLPLLLLGCMDMDYNMNGFHLSIYTSCHFGEEKKMYYILFSAICYSFSRSNATHHSIIINVVASVNFLSLCLLLLVLLALLFHFNFPSLAEILLVGGRYCCQLPLLLPFLCGTFFLLLFVFLL